MNRIFSLARTHHKILTIMAVSVSVIILRFIPLGYADIYGDGAMISFRSFGWFDWMIGSGQKTPFDWLGYVPGWGYLSFHDAPPLAFLAQKIFFSFAGTGIVAARLPFVLAGIGVVIMLYTYVKKHSSGLTAALVAILYSIISYSVWSEHSIYLEGLEEFFIVGSMLFGASYLFVNQESNNLYLWSIFTAGALLTKYTALFLLTPIVIYIVLNYRIVREHLKKFVWAGVIFIALLSPVIIYNAKMYGLRGHFDAALSSMVGMHPDDFSIISGRSVSFDMIGNARSIYYVIAENVSHPFIVLFGICLVVLIWHLRIATWRSFEAWILLNLFFLMLMFSLTRPADRFLSIIAPFLALVVGLGIRRLAALTKNQRLRGLLGVIVIIVIAGEFAYALNTNTLKEPFGNPGSAYSVNKLQSMGFNELDAYVRKNIITGFPRRTTVRHKSDTVFTDEDIKGRSVIIYDDRILWSAQMWYMQKYYAYYRWPYISTSFLKNLQANSIVLSDLIVVAGKPAYFIFPLSPAVIDRIRSQDTMLSSDGAVMARELDRLSAPSIIVKDKKGNPAFRVYKIDK